LQDIDKQVEQLAKKLNVKDLKDPEKVKSLINRFTALWELNNGSGASGASDTATLFGQANVGISGDILSAIQNLRMGGG
jgi:hypothetical protein